MESISNRVSVGTVIGVALGATFLMTKSKLWRYLLLGGVVAAYFLIPSRSSTGRTVKSGITDFVERWPSIGGRVSRWIVK